jgi:Flp pilus assembly protein TadD
VKARAVAATFVVVAAIGAGAWFVTARTRATDVPLPPPGAATDPFLAEAVDAAVAAVRASPRDADAWSVLAMTYDANELPAQAEPCYRKALELRSGVAQWWYDLAVVLEREDRFDDAANALFHAVEIDGTYPPLHYAAAMWALARGRLDEADVAAQRTLETSHGATGGFIALGRVQLDRGRNDEAVKTLERAVATWPKEWGPPNYPRFLLGTALARLGQTAEAAPLLATGAVDPPALPDAWREPVLARQEGLVARLRRAALLVDTGRLDEAIRVFEEVHRRAPQNNAAACDLGAAYTLAGRYDESIALLRKTQTEHPDLPEAPVRLVRALWAAGRPDEAMRVADDVVARLPESAVAHETRGGVLLDAGRAQDAFAEFETASRLAPADAGARATAGAALYALGRRGEAAKWFEDALRLESAQPTAVAGMALLALDAGDRAKADDWLSKIAPVPEKAARLVAEARAARARAQ